MATHSSDRVLAECRSAPSQLADSCQPVPHGVAMDVEFHRGILDVAVVTEVRAQRLDESGVQRRQWLTKDFEFLGAARSENDAERAQIPERGQVTRRTRPCGRPRLREARVELREAARHARTAAQRALQLRAERPVDPLTIVAPRRPAVR